MNQILWSVAGGIVAIGAEYLYRTLPGPWSAHWLLWLPITMAISLCVWHIVNTPGASLLSAFVIWTSTTIVLRTFTCLVLLKDPVLPGTWAAMALLVLARITQQVWK